MLSALLLVASVWRWLGNLRILVVELPRRVVYVLVNGALEFLLLMFYVIHPKADVAYSLAKLIIALSRE
jgi:hypothetical protein